MNECEERMCGVLGRLKIHARPTFYFTNGLIVGWNNAWMDESLEYNENEDEKKGENGQGFYFTLLYKQLSNVQRPYRYIQYMDSECHCVLYITHIGISKACRYQTVLIIGQRYLICSQYCYIVYITKILK